MLAAYLPHLADRPVMGAGKTTLARQTAQLCGRCLVEIALTGGTDTSDLLGSFEQVDAHRHLQACACACCLRALPSFKTLCSSKSSLVFKFKL